MKKSIFTLVIAGFIAGIVLTNCNSSAEKMDVAKANVQEASKNLDQAKEDYNKEYKKFKLESEQNIAANEKSIAELKEHAKKLKKEAKTEYEKTVAALEKRNEAMKEKVSDYKEDGNEKWAAFKREFTHDMDDLGQALKDLAKNNVN